MLSPTSDPIACKSDTSRRMTMSPQPSDPIFDTLNSFRFNMLHGISAHVDGKSGILLTDDATRLSSRDVESLQSSPSIREIIPHHGTTYTWAWFENPEEVEKVDCYCAGGYHPTHIGDKFHDGKYVVLNKLGHGTSSTVWLAQNTLIEGEYVALKILTAEASNTFNEHNIRAHLQSKRNPQHPGYAYVASSFGSFYFSGPNGYHLCLVDEAVGCNLEKCKQSGLPIWTFPIKASRAIVAQVILGLSYLHSLGVCHGDFDISNILLDRPFQGLSVKEINKQYHTPNKLALHRADNAPIGPEAPSYLVYSMAPIPCHEITSCRVKISDFSSAFMVGHEPKYASTTLTVTPPEALFDEKLTFSMDLWSLGCTLYEIVSDEALWPAFGGLDYLIRNMVDLLGPLPGPWWEKWERTEEFFTKDQNPIESKDEPSTLEYRMRHLRVSPSEASTISEAEATSLGALLSAMLVYKPSERVSMEEALKSDYMKNWAEPALEEALREGLLKP